MTTMPLTETPATCDLPWCTGGHTDTRSYRSHASAFVRDGNLSARISWAEPLDAAARYLDGGPGVYIGTTAAPGLRLPLRDLGGLAVLLDGAGATRLAGVVHRVLAVGGVR